ncbi:MAG: sialidase family protein [Pseudomonadota bacterium]
MASAQQPMALAQPGRLALIPLDSTDEVRVGYSLNRLGSKGKIESMHVLFRLVSVAVAVVLTGCAVPSQVIMLPEPTAEQPFDYTATGVVTIQVADTSPFATYYPINQVTFAPKDVEASEESKYLRAAPISGKGESSKLFVAELPAGEYSISSLRSFHVVGSGWFSQVYPGGITLGTFKVEPGQLTDLGVVVVYVRRSGDDYGFATTRAASANRAVDHLRAALPARAQAIGNFDEPLLWDDDGLDDDRYNAYLNAVNRQIALGVPDIDVDTGSLTFPGPLGVMLTRTSDREWQLDAYEDDIEIRFFNRTAAREWMVTEFDELFMRETDDGEWQQHAAPGDDAETLIFVGENSAGAPFAITRRDDFITIWTANAVGGDWATRHSIESKRSVWTGNTDLARFSTVARSGDYIFLALRNKLYRYAVDAATLGEVDGMSPDSLQTRNRYITATSGSMFASDKVSFDNGTSWTKYRGDLIPLDYEEKKKNNRRTGVRAINTVGHPIFIDQNVAYAIQDGGQNKDNFLIKSTNGAKTWSQKGMADLPEGCNQLVLATESEVLLGCYLTGEFYRSDDGGASWTLERSVSET